jgi:hypothetical protein
MSILIPETLLRAIPLLAEPSMPVCWFIVGFFMILGWMVTLSPPRRTYEVKKPKED